MGTQGEVPQFGCVLRYHGWPLAPGMREKLSCLQPSRCLLGSELGVRVTGDGLWCQVRVEVEVRVMVRVEVRVRVRVGVGNGVRVRVSSTLSLAD